MCLGRLRCQEESGREGGGERLDVSDKELMLSDLSDLRAGEHHGIPYSFSKRLMRVACCFINISINISTLF